MESQPVISFADVCFAYEQDEVLHNVDFAIDERDMVAVVGPNGGGKTTLLRLVLGFNRPTRGSVQVFGKRPETVRKRIGYVPQHMAFDQHFPVSALDVVKMGRVDRRRCGPYSRRDREAALRALAQVDLADSCGRPFAALSGGQRQRVLIAQALVSDPDLLLLDEPTANVDAAVEHRLYGLLKELNRELTVVIVSHNVNVITGYVTHVLCVNHTASISSAAEVTQMLRSETEGGDLAVITHGLHCHVINPWDAMHAPHRGEPSAS